MVVSGWNRLGQNPRMPECLSAFIPHEDGCVGAETRRPNYTAAAAACRAIWNPDLNDGRAQNEIMQDATHQ